MRKVKLYEVKMPGPDEVISILGWDDEKEEIIILEGKDFAEKTLASKYTDKRTMKELSVEDGLEFFLAFPFMIAGSHCYAGEVYDE